MPWAIDTNILKHFTQPGMPEHAESVRAIRSLWGRGERVTTFAQCLIEFWSFLTRPSLRDEPNLSNPGLGLSIEMAELELKRVEGLFAVHTDTVILYEEWRLVLLHKVRGKQVHDTRIAAAAHLHGNTHLLTYNVDDFSRFSPFLIAVRPSDI